MRTALDEACNCDPLFRDICACVGSLHRDRGGANVAENGLGGSAHFVRHEDRYFVYNENGDLVIARFTPKGYAELDRTHLLERTSRTGYGPSRPGSRARSGHGQSDRLVVWSHPAFANRHVVLRNDEEIIRESLAAVDY